MDIYRRFYFYPSLEEIVGRSAENGMWNYTCVRCQWSGTKVNVGVNETETHVRYLCPECGLEQGGAIAMSEDGSSEW